MNNYTKRRVVITGIAPLCALSNDHEDLFEKVCRKQRILTEINKDTPPLKKLKSRWTVPCAELEADGKYEKELFRIRSIGSKSSYAAAKSALLAVADAGLEKADDDSAVFIGTDSMSMNELSSNIISFDKNQKMNVMSLPVMLQSAIASWITIVLGTHGISSVLNLACASSTAAIGFGYNAVKNGSCDMSVCGGVSMCSDSNLTLLKSFEYIKCCTTDTNGVSYPFSEERNGFLFNEGAACTLVLEELQHAKKRGAEIYAEITGFEASSDAYDILSTEPDGDNIKKMLLRLIDDKKIDYYNSHATATMANDKTEAKVIKSIFGSKAQQPAISATKCILGNAFGASGALEAAICVDSIRHGKVHGNTIGTLIDDLNITSETRTMNINTAISVSYGFGGHNAAIMLEKYTEK